MIRRREQPVESLQSLEQGLTKRRSLPGVFYMEIVEGRDEDFQPIMEGTERLTGRYEMAAPQNSGEQGGKQIIFRADEMPSDYTLAISDELVAVGKVAIIARRPLR